MLLKIAFIRHLAIGNGLIMAINWETFERYRQKGLDARRAGQWDSARVYLLEAARAIVAISKDAQTPELRAARQEMAEKLLALAKDCEKAKANHRRPQTAPRRDDSSSGGQSESDNEGVPSGEQWLVQEKPDIKFADVSGLDGVKEDIRLKLIYPFEHPELAAKFGVRAGGGLLLYGPPGTGKTMLAKATAGEIDAAFFRVSPADIMSKWPGEAERRIKGLFEAARAAPKAIIFIDEIESLIPRRGDDTSSVMQRLVPQILQEMEGFDKKANQPVMFMGATNVPWQLDPAVLRPGRFDEKVYIPLPDLPARRKMLEMYLSHRPIAADVNLDQLANDLAGYSGADIKYICDRSAVVPFLQSVASGQDGEQITQQIIMDVIHDTARSVLPELLKRFDEWAKSAANG